jgi:hypothetical protein
MRTAASLLFIVIMIWVGLEIFTKGTHGAFDGAFSAILSGDAATATPPAAPMERIRSSVADTHREHDARTSRLIGDEPAED